MTPIRLVAARLLLDVEARRATLAGALDRAYPASGDPRDAGLLIELTAGTLRWQNELDALIARASRRPVAGIDAPARAVLRLGAYQLRHLDRVPAHAVVHEAVDSVRALGAPRAAGFVNAVLRTLTRGQAGDALPPRPPPTASPQVQAAYLTTTLSHPAWLVERWIARYGFDAAARWCEFNNTPPTLTIRTRSGQGIDDIAARLAAEGIAAERSPYVVEALRLPPGALGRLPDGVRAEVRVQDEGSQIVARLVHARPGERVLDACAAPGGKTLMLAEDMSRPAPSAESMLVASDWRPRRVELLAALLRSAGSVVPVVALDATQAFPFGAVFDRVLLDAPCSGLGTLRRDPDLKWTRTAGDLLELVRIERAMLARAAEVVRPGGRLIYATCSSEPEENLDVVRGFLDDDGRFSLEPVSGVAPELVAANGCLTTTPPTHGLDAFFAAVLVRHSGA
jgi:16S rRNA (cytosine967-C5)-methyltransferase